MGRTLFQMLKNKAGGPAELKVYNPLKLTVGTNVHIDAIDLRDLDFKVTGLRETNRYIGTSKFQSVDYQLIGNKLGQTPDQAQKVRLRLNPMDVPDPVSGMTHNVVVLSLYYECGYKEAQEQGLIDAVNAGTGEFDIEWDGTRKYFRINDTSSSYIATVKVLEDLDGNGSVEEDEIREQTVEFWDYHTELLNEAGQKYTELLFVEKNTSDGWFQIWRGSEINPEQVSAY